MNNELATRRRWFVVVVTIGLAAVPLLLWSGRGRWFFLDEWVVLSHQVLGAPGSLLDDHNGHLVTGLALEQLLLYKLFGLHSYLPYQLVSVLVHVAVVLVGWLVMIRLAVRPMIASLVALTFLLFGSGATNILWGFQVSLTASIVLGLLHLLLADHDGPWEPRDTAGLALGLGGLLCSAVSIPLVAGVGAAVLIRRGWRPAAGHVIPLAATYGVWYALVRDASEPEALGGERDKGLRAALEFVWAMVSSSAEALGGSTVAGFLIAVLVAIGVGSIAVAASRSDLRARLGVPVALLVASSGFALVTAAGRAGSVYGAELGSAERYVHVYVALLLPLVGAGCEALARRGRVAGFAAAALVVAGVPNNVRLLTDQPAWGRADRNLYETAARSPLLAGSPADLVVLDSSMFPGHAPTVGLLLDAATTGRIDRPTHVDPVEELRIEMALGLQQRSSDHTETCTDVLPLTTRLQPGDRVTFEGPIRVEATRDGVTQARAFDSDAGEELLVTARDLPVTIRAAGTGEVRSCVVPRAGA